MSSVDNRIVAMQFDNKNFESKLADTMRSLDKLRTSLDFASSKRGIEDLAATGNRFNMGGMGAAVDGISGKFVALASVGITAIANLTNRAVDAGMRMASALTLDPVRAGFEEFELKMGSIQTIMSGSGASLETVNNKLQELNEYSDKTIYSFKDMTSNIGKFTNAGVSLDKSVAAIQGVANVAALSGANSNEASRAMYNFAQAISTGSVKLIDWKSIELANMGTVEFKQQLIDSAVAMGTLTKSGDGYKTQAGTWMSATKSFNNSLQDGWLTSEALTETLGRFADETTDIGKRATAAATDVKTFSMMVATMKESVGSGWAQTFEIIVGDFEEGKKLWTGINDWFSKTIGASADIRNNLLKGWKELGGRDVLIQGMADAFKALGSVLAPIKDAFRDIFPAMTAERLFEITQRFAAFTEKLKIGGETADKIRSIFGGFFSILKIGWEVIKGLLGFVGDLLGGLSGVGGGALATAASFGETITAFQKMLVEGGGIKKFFQTLGEFVRRPGEMLAWLREKLSGLFSDGVPGAEHVSGVMGRLGERMDMLGQGARKVADAWDWLVSKFQSVGGVLESVWDYISNWFGELGDRLAKVMKPGDFDAAVDAVNVGLLGAIALMFKKFLSNGLSFDFGGGFMEEMKNSLQSLTGVLEGMQANLKANALLKIAGAIGILAAALLVLSTIDSEALTRALIAMSVSFGQLAAMMALMSTVAGGMSGLRFSGLATGMILLATAALILSTAVKNLSDLGWEELAKGLLGVGVAMGIMVGALKLVTTNTAGLITAGLAMIAMATAMRIMAEAVQAFGEMSWGELAKGLIGVGAALAIIVATMQLVPTGQMLAAGLAMIPLATGLVILSQAVSLFAGIPMGDLAKGIGAIAVSLTLIGLAMHTMPLSMPLTAAGLVLVGVALGIISGSVALLGNLDMVTLAKGIGALAAVMTILAVALNAMNGTAAGAAAMIVASGAIVILTGAMAAIGQLSIAQIATSLIALAAAFTVLFVAAVAFSSISGPLMALGVALAVIGASFALFGIGAMLVAKAFETMARAGRAGVNVMLDVIEALITALPRFIGAFVQAVISVAQTLVEAAPVFLKAITALLAQILATVIELTPMIAEAIGAIITAGLTLLREKIPELIETGWAILMAILQGIRDNIFELVTVGVEILANLAAGLVQNMATIVTAGLEVIFSFIGAITQRMGEIVAAGMSLIVSFVMGITQNIGRLVAAATVLITTFLQNIANAAGRIVAAGLNILVQLISGILNNITKFTNMIATLILTFINNLGNAAGKIVAAGLKMLTDLLKGIGDNLIKVTNTIGTVVTRFIGALSENSQKIINAGVDALVKFLKGISDNLAKVTKAGVDVVIKFINSVGAESVRLARAAADALIDFLNGLAAAIREKAPQIRQAGGNIASAIIEGITGGLGASAAIRSVVNAATNLAKSAFNAAKSFLGINSPSKKFIEIGNFMAQGMALALDRDRVASNSAENFADRVTNLLANLLDNINAGSLDIGDLEPVIRPVLDLSNVKAASRGIGTMLTPTAIAPQVSYSRAQTIATTTDLTGGDTPEPVYTGPAEIKFEQNIYSPTALSTNDIYRGTKSQIAVAKEELSI